MLTLGKILLISSLYISLPFWSHAKPNLEIRVARSIAEALKTKENQSISLASDTNLNSNTENRNNSNLKASISPFLNTSDKIHEITDSSSNLAIDNITESPRPTPTPSTSSPLIHGIVSRLPWNSTIADEHFLPVSAHPNTTSVVSSEKLPWSLDNDTLKTPGNNSTTVSILPPAPTTKSVTPLTTESTEWLTTSSDSFAGFTPYREETTLQPTVKFTNNSKIVPNTSDPQKENRNTGVVFGAILGAILGASLLSLVGYLLCGKRKTDSFSHRRLYDDRNEPDSFKTPYSWVASLQTRLQEEEVLRLDNAPEPYDVSFGNSSYYNSTVSDSSMPEGRENARDGIPMDDIPPLRTSVSN